jgi:hypothetical protein
MSSNRRCIALTMLLAAGVLGATATSASAAGSSNARAQALATSAFAATKAATSFVLQGTGISNGQPVKIDVTVSAKHAFGVLTYGGESVSLRRVNNTIYAKGTQGFLMQQGLTAAQASVEANKWITIPSSDTTDFSNIDKFLTTSGVLSGLLPAKSTGQVTSATRSSLHGQAVEVIVGTFDNHKATIYVATHGRPYILRVVQPSGSAGGGTVNLSTFNQAVHVTAPS